MQARLSFLVLLFSALLLLASPVFSAGGSGPSGEGVSRLCEAAIDKAAGRYSQCLLKASAKFAKKKNQDDRLFAQQMRCGEKFDNQVARAQDRYGEEQCTPYTSQIADRTKDYASATAAEAHGFPMVSLLFVQNGTGGTLSEDTLTLTGTGAQTGWFADRPYRLAGQVSTQEFLENWDEGDNSFSEDPPNADFTCMVDGEVVNFVVELSSPNMPGDDLSYTVKAVGDTVLPETPIACEAGSHLFVDSGFQQRVLEDQFGRFDSFDWFFGQPIFDILRGLARFGM